MRLFASAETKIAYLARQILTLEETLRNVELNTREFDSFDVKMTSQTMTAEAHEALHQSKVKKYSRHILFL